MSKKKNANTKKSNSSMKFAVILTVFAFAVLAGLVVYSNNNKANNDTDQTYEKMPSIEGQPIIGSIDAPVQVVEFGDFKCPSCKLWGETVFEQLKADYIDKGDVKFSYINVLFHGEESELASSAAEAVFKQNPDRYWEFHKNIFAAQPDQQQHDNRWVTEESMTEIAKATPDIDLTQFQEDFQSKQIIDEVKKDSKIVDEFNLQFTPSVMVNGIMLQDPFDYEKIKSLIDEALEGNQ